MRRLDLFAECNAQGAPVDVFTAECCMRCINPECSRSSFGSSKFDIRVNSWYERLFSQVPRMESDDPRLGSIAAQRFVAINPSLTVNSGWVDPRDLEVSQPKKAQELPSPQVVQPQPEAPNTEHTPALTAPPAELSSQPASSPAVELPVPPEAELSPRPAAAPQPGLPHHLATANTPVQRGQMVGPATPPKPASSWDAPVPPIDNSPATPVVQRGAKIKIGGPV